MKKIFLLIFVLCAFSTKAQTTLNSVYYTDATSSTSITLPGGVPSTKGNVLGMAINTSSNTTVITGATDNKGNNWVVGPSSVDNTGGTSTAILRTTGLATTGVTSITISATTPGSGSINVYLYDISITASSYTVTSNFLSNQGTTTTPVGPSITPTGAGIILSIIFPSAGAPHTVASPFTLANSDGFSAYYLNSSSSTISPNWTSSSGTWDATILSIVPTGGACPSSVSALGINSCVFVSAAGSDSNNGLAESSSWLHAPGMSTCTANCSSYTPTAGTGIIFRGGDTWHFGNSGLSPFAGFQSNAWNLTNSGTSTFGQLNPACSVSRRSCIFIGVVQAWFSGGSWTRPILNFDNPLTNTSPSSCAFDDTTLFPIAFSGNYVIVDNFEVLGFCSNSTNTDAYIFNVTGTMKEFKNLYVHGYMLGTLNSDNYFVFGGTNSQSVYQRYDHNVFDNSDGTDGNSTSAATLGVFNQSLQEADHNVLNQVSNGLKYRYATSIHDNLFQNIYESPDPATHSNIMEWQGTGTVYTNSNYYFNNLTICPGGNSNVGESVDMYPGGASSSKFAYIFNNISNCSYNGGIGTNCYMIEGDGGNGGPGLTEFFNNTSIKPCLMRSLRGNSTGVYQNNYFVGYSPSGSVSSDFSSMTTVTDNGNEVWQTTGAACGSSGTNYAPTAGTCATVGTGVNLVSICNGMDNASATTACKNGYAGVTYNTANHTAVNNTPVAHPVSGAWDAGAYQFTSGGGSSGVSFSPTSLTFGSQIVSTTSSSQTVTLTNSGSATLVLSSNVTITGTNAGDFSISSSTCTNGADILAGSNCTFSVGFTPSATGSRTAIWTVSDNASGSPQTGSLTGTGVTGPVATFSPTSVPFGNQVVSTTSSSQSVTLTNTGGTNLVLSSTLSVTGTNASDFSISSNTCINSTTITPSSTCTFSVAFTPGATGSRSALWTVSDNASGSPQTGALTGTGVPAGTPAVTFSPTSLSFGSVLVGNASSPLTVLMENTGTSNLILSSGVTFAGTNASDFSLSGSSTCINGATVAPSSSCTIIVVFTPGALGARSANWTVSDNASGSPHTGALSGTGTAPGVSFSPTSLTFGSQIVSTTSATQTVTLTNSGTANLLLSSNVTTTGTNSVDFAISSSTCTNGTTVLPGNTCTFAVAFTPSATGTRSASWTVSDNAAGSPQAGALSGTGISLGVPGVVFTPTSLSFSSQVVSTTSFTQTVTLTNSGTANLILSSNVTIVGTNAGDYAVSGSTCTNGATITPSSTCVFSVSFTPSATGTRTANWTVSDNATGSPQTGALTGNGITSVLPAPGTVMFTAIPLPVQIPTPTISSVIPLQPYVTAKGCSEDGVTWNKNCPVRLICNGCSPTTKVTFDGKPVTGTYKTGEIDVNLPLSMLAASEIPVQHVFSMNNPLAVVQVVQ